LRKKGQFNGNKGKGKKKNEGKKPTHNMKSIMDARRLKDCETHKKKIHHKTQRGGGNYSEQETWVPRLPFDVANNGHIGTKKELTMGIPETTKKEKKDEKKKQKNKKQTKIQRKKQNTGGIGRRVRRPGSGGGGREGGRKRGGCVSSSTEVGPWEEGCTMGRGGGG